MNVRTAQRGTPGAGREKVRHHLARRLGVAGGALGVLAGLLQATVGERIPTWTGDKLAPGSLGLLTVALSLVAVLVAVRQARPGLDVAARAGSTAVLLVVALLCFSTVGRLWYLPGVLLLLTAALTLGSVPASAGLVAGNWLRCLLGALGAGELLMAAGARPLTMAVGIGGAAALLAAAWLTPSRRALLGLIALGTVPFAILAWTAVVPVVLLLTATALGIALTRGRRAGPAVLRLP